jgi:hypothetical protein
MTVVAARPVSMQALNAALLDAHEAGNGPALAALYGEAAGCLETQGDRDAACFYYTQAYVFALEAGLPAAETYAAFLRANRRL